MKRYQSFLLILVLALSLGAVTSCGPKTEGPPPECKVDFDCGPNKTCSGGKCLVKRQSPKQKAEGYIKHANLLLKEAKVDYPAVIAAYKSAMAAVPTIEGLDFNIAICYMKMGQFAKAEPVFKEALAKNPDDLNYLMALGRLYVLQNKQGAALKMYLDYQKKHPKNLEIATNIATIYRLKKDYDKAMVQIRKIFVQDPAHPGAFNNLGLVYLAKGEFLLARMVTANGINAQENVKKKPDATLYNNMGLIYLKMGDIDRAVANFRIAKKYNPNQVASNLNLGHISLKYADYGTAKVHYDAVLSEDPNNKAAMLGLAQCLGPLNKGQEALALYTKLEKMDPKDPIMLFNLGVLYFDYLKKQDEAHRTFRRFLKTKYKDAKKVEAAEMYLEQEIYIEEPEQPEQPVAEEAAPEKEQLSPAEAAAKAAAEGVVEEQPAEAPKEDKEEKKEEPKEEKPAAESKTVEGNVKADTKVEEKKVAEPAKQG